MSNIKYWPKQFSSEVHGYTGILNNEDAYDVYYGTELKYKSCFSKKYIESCYGSFREYTSFSKDALIQQFNDEIREIINE